MIEEAGMTEGEAREIGAEAGWDMNRRIAEMMEDNFERWVGREVKEDALSERR